MKTEQILAEIREANLSYLMLAQSLIRSDREQALFRLGVTEETAALIGTLTSAQMMKIAAGNTLLCRFRMDDDMVWNLLTNHGKGAANDGMSRLHASILLAGRHQDAACATRPTSRHREPHHGTQQEHPHRSPADRTRRHADPARSAASGAGERDRPQL